MNIIPLGPIKIIIKGYIVSYQLQTLRCATQVESSKNKRMKNKRRKIRKAYPTYLPRK